MAIGIYGWVQSAKTCAVPTYLVATTGTVRRAIPCDVIPVPARASRSGDSGALITQRGASRHVVCYSRVQVYGSKVRLLPVRDVNNALAKAGYPLRHFWGTESERWTPSPRRNEMGKVTKE